MATKKKNLKAPKKADAPKSAAQGTATANPAAQPDPTALSIGDLKNLSSIIDVASTRGAFKANEMAGVGFLYNKLSAFIAKVAPAEPKADGTPTVGNDGAGMAPAPTQEK
jgi:hypothetical protein|tara:strand:+ start:681 stop:1010 length:330 start_codon:yes stop_codon:yes gene_type:complete